MKSKLFFAGAFALCIVSLCTYQWQGAEAHDDAGTYAGADVDLHSATHIIEAAVKKAEELDTKMDICVVDAGANLKAFVRMDGHTPMKLEAAQTIRSKIRCQGHR